MTRREEEEKINKEGKEEEREEVIDPLLRPLYGTPLDNTESKPRELFHEPPICEGDQLSARC